MFSRVESVYFLLSFIYIFCLFDLEPLVRKSASIILMSVGKLSPLNDMLHYFVALKGKKMWQENEERSLLLLTPGSQPLWMQVNKDEVRAAGSVG